MGIFNEFAAQSGGLNQTGEQALGQAENIYAPVADEEWTNEHQIQGFANDYGRQSEEEVETNIAAGLISREDADPVKWKSAIDTAKGLGMAENQYNDVYDNLEEFSKEWKNQEIRRYVENCEAMKDMCIADANFLNSLDEKSAKDMADINFNLAVYGQPDKPNEIKAFGQRVAYQIIRSEKGIETASLAGKVIGLRGDERRAAIAIWKAEHDKLVNLPDLDTSGFGADDFILATADQLPIMLRTQGAAAAGAGIGAGVGSVVPAVGTAAGAATGYFTLGKGLAALTSYNLETNSMMESLLDIRDADGKEIEPLVADSAARAYGMLAAVIEMVGMDKVMAVIPNMKTITKMGLKKAVAEAVKDKTKREVIMEIIKDYGLAVATEGAEEFAQQLTQAEVTRGAKALMNALYDTNFAQDSIINDLAEAGEAGIAGAKASVLFSGTGSALRVKPELSNWKKEQEARQAKAGKEVKAQYDAKAMDSLAQSAQSYMQSPAAEKATLKSYLQKAKSSSVYQDIYMSGDDAKAFMISEAAQNNKEVLEKSGLWDNIQGQIAKADELGTPVRIPFETFGSEIMANKDLYMAVKDMVKTYENGITMAELKLEIEKRNQVRNDIEAAVASNEADFDYAYKWIIEQETAGNIDLQRRGMTAEFLAKLSTYMAKNSNTPINEFMFSFAPQFERSFDGSVGGGQNVQDIIGAIRASAQDNEAQNLMKRAGELGKRDARQITKILSKHLDEAAQGDVQQFMRIANAIGDMKLNIEAMSDEDIIKNLNNYMRSGDLKINIKRNAADRVKSGIFSAGEQALANIQENAAGSDYVLVGGGRVPVNYEIVELGDVITSHDDAGMINESYPQELQPRDRSRSASDGQIAAIVNNFAPERVGKAEVATEGAPIITEQGFVAVGNGRAMAIRQMYNNPETVQKYQSYLTGKGFDLSGFEKPVLVRRLGLAMDGEQLSALVDDANTSGTMQYSDSENALRDADKMSGNLLDLLDMDADIDSAANRRFLNGFFAEVVPTAERNAYLDKDDRITRKGVERVENALTAKLLPDARFLSILVENPDNNIRKVTKELAKAAPAIIAFENDIAAGRVNEAYSIAADVAAAVDLLKRAKDRGYGVIEFIQMHDMFEEPISSSTQNMVQLFENSTGAADFLGKIRNYIRQASAQGDMAQGNMFDIEPVSKAELLEREVKQDSLFQAATPILSINSQEAMAGLSENDFKEKMLTTLKSFKKMMIPNKSLGGDIEIRTSSIKKYKSFFADKNKRLIVPHIPELLARAEFVSENTYTPETESNIIAYWKADLPIKIDTDVFDIHLTVKQDNNGNFFWDAQVQEKTPRTTPATNPGDKGPTSEQSEDALSITPAKANVKADINSEAFKRWFGNSKVVDEKGNPLVVYHGTSVEFDEFKGKYHFFTDDVNVAGTYGSKSPMAVYLSMKNPFIVDAFNQSFSEIYNAEGNLKKYSELTDDDINDLVKIGFDSFEDAKQYYQEMSKYSPNDYINLAQARGEKARSTNEWVEYAKSKGYDGVIIKNVSDAGDLSMAWKKATDYIVFEPNQIKSVNNRGTWDAGNNKIYYQSAFYGSRVDHDKPSLDAIGTGEGAQMHGWGLYYALNKEIAESYRKRFTTAEATYDGKPLAEAFPDFDEVDRQWIVLGKKWDIVDFYRERIRKWKDRLTSNFSITDEYRERLKHDIAKAERILEFAPKIDLSKLENNGGQVIEVDLPENPFLLDEQKTWNEQSDYVKHALTKIRLIKKVNFSQLSSGLATGKDIYKTISEQLGSDRLASEALESVGIKGIAYDGAQDGQCFVIFNPDDVKVIQKFYQLDSATPEAYGAYTPLERKITLFRNNNLSTLIHESGHWWLDTLSQLVQSGKANDKMHRDYDVIKSWLGVGEDGIITTEQHEKFARGVEKYFRTRKAPSSKIAKLFDTFQRWLTTIYKDVRELDVDLTDEVANVFDHYLASEAEIEEYRQANQFAEMLAKSQNGKLTPAELEKYTDLAAQSLSAAREKHMMDKIALILKEETEAYKEKQKQLKAQVLEEWAQDRINKVVYILVTGEVPHGKLDIKIKTEELQALLGNDFEKFATFGGNKIFADDGITLAELEEFTGLKAAEVKSGLLTARVRMRNFKNELSRRTHEELGDPVTYEDVEKQVVAAVWNDKQTDLLDMDLQTLARQAKRQPVAVQGFKQWAQKMVSRMAVKELKPDQYAKQMQISGDKALQALNHGNKTQAYKYKIEQIRNFVLYREVSDRLAEVESSLRRLKQIGKQETNTSVDQVYQDAARSLLARFTLSRALTQKAKERLGHLSSWILEQRSNGYDIVVPMELLEKNNGMSYAELTVDEFLALSDSIKSLIANGRAIKEYEIEGQILERDKAIFELGEQLKKTYKRRNIQKSGKKKFKGISEMLAPKDAAIITLGALSNRIDGHNTNGIFSKLFLRRMTESQNRENELLRLYGGKMKALQDKLPESVKSQLYENVAGARDMLGADYTRAELISIGLNMGNLSNLQRLKEGNGFNDQKLGWVMRTLSQAEWDYIQGVWDTLETMYPMLAEHHKKMSGLDMDHVIAVPLNTPYGKYRGGYFPLFYDRSPDMEARANNSLEQALLESDYGRATTSTGYTKQRKEVVKEKIKFDLALINRHLTSAIHDLAWRANIRQMWNLANNPDFIATMDGYLHEGYRKMLLKLIKDLANSSNREAREMTFAEGIARNMRVARTTIGLGFRIKTAAKQLTGFAQSVAIMHRFGHKNKGKHNGAYWLTKAVQAFASDASVREWCVANSGELKARLNNMDANIAEAMKGVAKKQTKFAKASDNIYQAAFWAIGKMDVFTASSTWYGAYLQARDDFGYEHKDAVYYADRVMIESQGSGNLKDKPALQRASEWEKMLLMFYSPFSGMYGLWTSVARDLRDGRDVPQALADLTIAMCVPAWLDAIVDGEQPDGDDDLAEWLKFILLRPLAFWASTMPIARDLVSHFEYGRTQGFFTDTFKAASDFTKAFTSDKMTAGKRVNKVMNATAQAVGTFGGNVPIGGQLADWTQWLIDVAAGNIKIDSPIDVFWGVWRGKDGAPKQ